MTWVPGSLHILLGVVSAKIHEGSQTLAHFDNSELMSPSKKAFLAGDFKCR